MVRQSCFLYCLVFNIYIIIIFIIFFTLQYCIGFAIHKHESAMGVWNMCTLPFKIYEDLEIKATFANRLQ